MKRRQARWSLAGRITWRTAAAVVGTGMVLSLLTAAVAVRVADRALAARARMVASLLAGGAADPVALLNVAGLREQLAQGRRAEDVLDAVVFDTQGRVLTDGTVENPRRHHPVGAWSRRVLQSGVAEVTWRGDWVVAAAPVLLGRRVAGGVVVTLSTRRIRRQAWSLAGELLAAGLLFAVLVAALAWRGARDALRPLKELRRAVEATVHGTGGEIPLGGPEEVRAVAAAFSTLLARLRVTTVTRDLLKNTLDGVGEGLLVLSENGVVEDANGVVARLAGTARERLYGRPAGELLSVECEGGVEKMLGEALENPDQPFHCSGELVTGGEGGGDGLPILLTVRATRRIDGGLMVVCLLRDASDLRRVETMKERFLAAVSHELRTPLTSIRGALALLAEGRVGTLPEEARRMAAIGLVNSERLGALIDDLLDLQQAAEGRLGLELAAVDVAAVVTRAAATARGAAEAAGIRLELTVEGDATVHADAGRLEQVVGNLLSNALKHAPSGSTVEVAVRPAGDTVRIEVTDSGPGVPASFVPFLFQRFTQADDSDGRRTQGSGLGLALVKELVEGMGGRVGYAEREGGGSIFWVDLAAYEQGELGDEAKADPGCGR